jgi:osmotically-inducible protein OsmY
MQTKEILLKQIQAAIEQDAHIDWQTQPITLRLDGGQLLLEGEVPDVGTKRLAVRAAAAIKEVARVEDRLRVSNGHPPGDGATRDAVCKLLLRDIDFQNCGVQARIKGQVEVQREASEDGSGSIEVAVADGVVTLTGQVISLSHKRLAGVLAWWARGCRDVANRLEVVPAEEDNDDEIADALRLVFESDPYVHADGIGIGCRDHVVTLEGIVATDGERRRAEFDAWYLFDVDKVVNRLEVR